MLKSVSTLLLACLCALPAIADTRIGVQRIVTDGGESSRQLSLSVWYPAGEGGAPEDVGGNAVFQGQPGYLDAPMADGSHPLVMLSHGGLRSAANSGAWLAARLAEAGQVVVEVNGPRPGSAQGAVDEVWRRSEDISLALDRVLNDPALSGAVDPGRIAVAGYALGGTAALALAGGRFDANAYGSTCKTDRDGPDCAWYAAQDVTLGSVDGEMMERPYRDPRIATAIALDPEHAGVFRPDSLAEPDAEIHVIWLGPQDRDPFDAFDLSRTVFESATRLDAFPVCTEAGPAILAEDGGDPALCGADATARADVHDTIADRIGALLDQ